MIKAILFDADGVLIIGKSLYSRILVEKYRVDQDEVEAFFREEFLKCTEGKRDLKELLSEYKHKWNLKKSIDEYLSEWFGHEHIIDEKLLKEIQHLRKKEIICCLATNQEKYRGEYILIQMEFRKYFDKTFISSSLGYRKPFKEYFQEVMKQLPGIEKHEILFWDDKEINTNAAKEFGWNAEVYVTFSEFKKKMKKYKNRIKPH